MDRAKILIIPACEPGRGGGHLTRCISLTRDLRSLGNEVWLFMPPQKRDLTSLYLSMNFNPAWCITNAELEIRIKKLTETFKFIILDYFKTSQEELLRWKKIAPVIGIDEGGFFRDSFDFLVDILIPEKFISPSPNIFSPALIIKNSAAQTTEETRSRLKDENIPVKILITFGQEDLAGLGIMAALTLSAMINKYPMDIYLLRGALADNRETENIPNIKVIKTIPNLSEHLCEYDIVITHYGITAYEALFAGTQVLLAHPTKYHKKLAKAAGFISFSNFRNMKYNSKPQSYTELHREKNENLIKNSEKLCALCGLFISSINHLERIIKRLLNKSSCGSWLNQKNQSFTDLCNSFSPIVSRKCPVCEADTPRHSVARFNDRTYRRCKKCGIIYMDRICAPPIEYGNEYFFESYVKQYGKTYLEDFPNLILMAKHRLKIINSLVRLLRLSGKKPSLFDIGCAYGPFLAAAKEEGFSPFGIDPAQDAVHYVQKKLDIPAVKGFFPVSDFSALIPNSYDVITLWWVIEHFKDCTPVFTEIRKLLKQNGILAFSTPSFSGISGRTSLRRFLSISPADHFTIWSPKTARKALKHAGFKIKKTVICGHHPERFPLLGKFAKNKKNPVYWLLLAISKIFGLGDTFEVYAEIST